MGAQHTAPNGPPGRPTIRTGVLAFCRAEWPMLARYGAVSLGRTGLAMGGILLVNDFLSGVLGARAGLAARFADAWGPPAALWMVAGLMLLTLLGTSLLTYASTVMEQRIVRSLELTLMERLIRHLLTLSLSFFDRQSHGDLLEAVRQDVAKVRMLLMSVSGLGLEASMAAGLMASALWLSPALAFTALPFVALASLPVVAVARRIRRRSYGMRRKGYVLFDDLLQMVRGIRVIKVYKGERSAAGAAIDRTRSYFDELTGVARIQAFGQVALESLGGFAIVVVTIVGGFQVMNQNLAWPSLLAFLLAIRALLGPLNSCNTHYLQIQRHAAAVDRLEDLLGEEPTVRDCPDGFPFPASGVEIAFDRVGFAYDGHRVLHDVSFHARAGEVLGIVGPSGAGKTTVLSLIARFHDPTSGVVRLNGRDLRHYRLADVYGHVAVVTQEPFLFSTTIRDNIRCGRPAATDRDVEAAAEAAEIHDEILALPAGYDTIVGIGGRSLSGGQVQRLNIARAILKSAPVLILDEAMSSLDSIAEAKVQRAIARLMASRTTFVAAHRLSSLRGADRILVLDQGRVAGIGSELELLRTCPLFRRMRETQEMGEPAGPLAAGPMPARTS